MHVEHNFLPCFCIVRFTNFVPQLGLDIYIAHIPLFIVRVRVRGWGQHMQYCRQLPFLSSVSHSWENVKKIGTYHKTCVLPCWMEPKEL